MVKDVLRIVFIGLLFSSTALAAVESPNLTDSPSPSDSVDDLIEDAQSLISLGNPIEARSKLQRAVQMAPNDYRPQMLLGAYYLSEVGHFRLALRYLRTAEDNFSREFGSDDEVSRNPTKWRDHARLLYYLAETRLNLDNYEGALTTLDRFGARYWDEWYPGSRAWVLMKLKRIDDAIVTAQAGLLRGAEPGRTYNILGILLSLKDNRALALDAFGRAIKAELSLGGLGQPATPLNNSGEVYREIFLDDVAESAFTKAIGLQDGCEHILPSLNLSIMYVDQLRLFQSRSTLEDFVACFAQNKEREDTEHRSLLALQRGRISLHEGNSQAALKEISQAFEREQWFGKIGTNENDVRFASAVAYADALESYAEVLSDTPQASWRATFEAWATMPALRIRAWWYRNKAREIALSELDDFSDLHIRSTDTMIEYPTLGKLTSGFTNRSLETRLARLEESDTRKGAQPYYELYRALNEVRHGSVEEGITRLEQVRRTLRDIDRLARAEALAGLAAAYTRRANKWFRASDGAEEDRRRATALIQELFELAPPEVRNHGLKLPVVVKVDPQAELNAKSHRLMKNISRFLSRRFEAVGEGRSKYTLFLSSGKEDSVELALISGSGVAQQLITKMSSIVDPKVDGGEGAATEFLTKVFQHRLDPQAPPLPNLDILNTK